MDKSSSPVTRSPGRKKSKMTPAKLERKRAIDRESQRATRTRTKNYISYLEKTIQDLEQNSSDERIQSLSRKVKDQQEQIEKFVSVVSAVSNLLRQVPTLNSGSQGSAKGLGIPESSIGIDKWPEAAAEQCDQPIEGDQPDRRPAVFEMEQTAPACPCELPETCGDHNSVCSSLFPFATAGSHFELPRAHEPMRGSLESIAMGMPRPSLGLVNRCSRYFCLLNNAFTVVHSYDSSLIQPDPARDDDIGIRAGVHGWQAVEQLHHLDKGWQFLRAFCTRVFPKVRPVERVAILRAMRLKLLVPTFLRDQLQILTV